MADFDQIVERRDTDSVKWQNAGDVLPSFIADCDFLSMPEIVEVIQKRAAQGVFGYMSVPESYYQAVIGWKQRRDQVDLQKDWLFYSSGVVMGLSLGVQTYTRPGDEIIIQPPVYPPFYGVVRSNGRQVVENKLIYDGKGGFSIDFDDLERKAKREQVTMMILCSPHNPTGNLWTREELERISQICLENNVKLLSDEIHSDLIFPGKKFVSVLGLEEKYRNNALVAFAPSKTFNVPGLCHAVLAAPGEEMRRMLRKTTQQLHLSGSIFGYYAAEAGYTYGDKWVDELMSYVEGNYRYLVDFMAEYFPEVTVTKVNATYLAWLDFTSFGMTSEELDRFFIEKVKVRPGEGGAFSPEYTLWRRFTLGCPRAYIEQILNNLKQAAGK